MLHRIGRATVDVTDHEVAVSLTNRVNPGVFGTLILPLSKAPGAVSAVLEDIDKTFGELTPEQKRFRDSTLESESFKYSEDEYSLSHGDYVEAATGVVELFVRAFPALCYYCTDLNILYDGFYGPMPGTDIQASDCSQRSPRGLIEGCFGEYRKSFARTVLQTSARDMGPLLAYCRALKNPDLLEEAIRTGALRGARLETTELGSAAETLSLISPYLRSSTLLSFVRDRSVVHLRVKAFFDYVQKDGLSKIKARTWSELAREMGKLPMETVVDFPESKDARQLEHETFGGYALRHITNSSELNELSIASDNCLYMAEHHQAALSGALYFALHESGNTVGTLRIAPGFSGIEALGVDNVKLERYDELEKELLAFALRKGLK